MTGHVIDFKPDGTAEAMHNDKFDLSFLGKQYIRRATELRFDEATQTWNIGEPWTLPDDIGDTRPMNPSASGFRTYEDARRVEVEWLNRCRLGSVYYGSAAGAAILAEARQALGV